MDFGWLTAALTLSVPALALFVAWLQWRTSLITALGGYPIVSAHEGREDGAVRIDLGETSAKHWYICKVAASPRFWVFRTRALRRVRESIPYDDDGIYRAQPCGCWVRSFSVDPTAKPPVMLFRCPDTALRVSLKPFASLSLTVGLTVYVEQR